MVLPRTPQQSTINSLTINFSEEAVISRVDGQGEAQYVSFVSLMGAADDSTTINSPTINVRY